MFVFLFFTDFLLKFELIQVCYVLQLVAFVWIRYFPLKDVNGTEHCSKTPDRTCWFFFFVLWRRRRAQVLVFFRQRQILEVLFWKSDRKVFLVQKPLIALFWPFNQKSYLKEVRLSLPSNRLVQFYPKFAFKFSSSPPASVECTKNLTNKFKLDTSFCSGFIFDFFWGKKKNLQTIRTENIYDRIQLSFPKILQIHITNLTVKSELSANCLLAICTTTVRRVPFVLLQQTVATLE